GLFHRRQCRGDHVFIHLLGQRAIPGDTDQGSNVAPQIVHRPGNRIRDVGLIHTELVVLPLRVIVKVWLVLEAIEAQQLHWLALDIAIDPQRWPVITSSGICIPDVETEPAYPNHQSLFRHCHVPPRAWIPLTGLSDSANIAYLHAGVKLLFVPNFPMPRGWARPAPRDVYLASLTISSSS